MVAKKSGQKAKKPTASTSKPAEKKAVAAVSAPAVVEKESSENEAEISLGVDSEDDSESGESEMYAGFGTDEDDEDEEGSGSDDEDESIEGASEVEDDDDEEEDDKSGKKKSGVSTEKEEEIKGKIAAAAASKKGKNDGPEKPGVLYIGRIPHGFYEKQMRAYFSQFGDITRLRLSRNKKSGASKHYAFLEFASRDVAQIVAETMNNYLLFGHILKVSLIPEEQVHEKTFEGSNRTFRAIPRTKIAQLKHDRKRTSEETDKLVGREEKRRKEKQDKLKALGIDYSIPASKQKVKSH
ncbi:hypothetical protein BZA70DRAFT_273471 [Myxozyma melibiosi]|uniref:RRM domain-containing protein n=1 Tax=Myxozyma melibiosi TaxID=54550 RepID=A0ABR1FEN9_9ASCO